uniref:Uncharacterized protein n=1 Tax=Urocitellus parryii TaxID=9999 RepID=A0A8D2HPL1_UROPR
VSSLHPQALLSKSERKRKGNCGWWLMPVIPVAQEAEAGGSLVQSQLQQLREALSNLKRHCVNKVFFFFFNSGEIAQC